MFVYIYTDDIIASGKYIAVSVALYIVIKVIEELIPNITIQYITVYAYTINTACVLISLIRLGIRKNIKRYLGQFLVQRNVESTISMTSVISDTSGYFAFMKLCNLHIHLGYMFKTIFSACM